MKGLILSVLATVFLGFDVTADATADREREYDPKLVERLLKNKRERLFGKGERKLEDVPSKQLYKQLIYMEQRCRNFQVVNVQGTILNPDPLVQLEDFMIGDVATFKCPLYEEAFRFDSTGGRRVGDSFWNCKVIAFEDLRPSANPFQTFTEPVWDCTILDYIGADEDEEELAVINFDTLDTLRNEGLMFFLYSPTIQEGSLWEQFHSHNGKFATTGGVGLGKGARGQMEVIYDFYLQAWFHIYTVEVWQDIQDLPGDEFRSL